MKRHMRTMALILVLLIPGGLLMAEGPDFNDLDSVLSTFSDSRKTRDLKIHGTADNQAAFTKTLETKVYKPVDRAVIQHIEAMPEYAGKRILTHDFRTPGKNGVSVNTDRDVRVLVEVEMDRWIEVPVDKWQDVYHREFAKRTGLKAADTASPAALKEHAARYRQLPTDRFHIEAGADYTDVGTIRAFEVNGQTKVLSTPNVVRAKRGFTRLKDPEGLARMYLEKADEQYRQAKDLERKLKSGKLSDEARLAYQDRLEMHEIEGTVQLKKGVESLEALRAGYEKQGYDVGRLPEALEKAAAEIKKVDGTSGTDIKKIKAQLSTLEPDFIKDLADVNRKVSGQIESLKMARKKPAPTKMPGVSLAKAGQAAGIAGDILSIKDALEKAEQGNHLFINFNPKDSKGEKALKAMALAAIELSPIPVVDAMERGWQVDEEEKDYLTTMMAHGEYGDWKTHPVTSMARVSTKIVYRTVSAMTIDTLVAGKTAVEEGYTAAKDVGNNFIAEFSRQESEQLQKLKFDAAVVRGQKFNLDGISIRLNNGPYYGNVTPGDTLRFITDKNKTWTAEYQVRWEMLTPEGGVIRLKDSPASEEKAGILEFAVPALAFGEYKVVLRGFEKASGLQANFTEARFKMNEKIDLGNIIATNGTADGQPVTGAVTSGDAVAFRVDKIGDWHSGYEVQWLVDGQTYRKTTADQTASNDFTLKTNDLKPGTHNIAVRILERTTSGTGKIRAHRGFALNVKAKPTQKKSDASVVIGPGEPQDVHQRGYRRWHQTVNQFVAQIPPCLHGEFYNWARQELLKLGDDKARQEYIGKLTLDQLKADRAGVFAHTGGFWADEMAKKPFNQCSAKWIVNMRDAGFITYPKAWGALNAMWKLANYEGMYPGPRSKAEAEERERRRKEQMAFGLMEEVHITPVASQPVVPSQTGPAPATGFSSPGPAGVNTTQLGQARFRQIVDGIMRDVPSCMGNPSQIRQKFERDANVFAGDLGRLSEADFSRQKDQILRGAAKNNLNILKQGGIDSCERQWLSNYQARGLLSANDIGNVMREEERHYVVFTMTSDKKGLSFTTPLSWEIVEGKPRTGLFGRFPNKYAVGGYAYRQWIVAVGPISRQKAEMYCAKARQGKIAITGNYTPWIPTGGGENTGYQMKQGEYITKSIGVMGGW